MRPVNRPWWQQATALVSLGAGGAITGLSFVPQPPADLTSPTSLPIHLMALEQSARQASAGDAALRSAIINVAKTYLRLAQTKSPAEMQAMIWQQNSLDRADHGSSCAAFASMTLAMGARAVGQQSWVTGGSSYPWPLHRWADVRVNPNPASPGITSIVQDAQAHKRWHAFGDGYQPQPGDWVVFDGHVEVVTQYSGGALQTIGADSLPNYSVNAHDYPAPVGGQGVLGFVDNGRLAARSDGGPSDGGQAAGAGHGNGQADLLTTAIPGTQEAADAAHTRGQAPGDAAIPGTSGTAPGHGTAGEQARNKPQPRPERISYGRRATAGMRAGKAGDADRLSADVPGQAAVPGQVAVPGQAAVRGRAAAPAAATADTAIIPGLPIMAQRLSGKAAAASAPPGAPAGSQRPTRAAPSAANANPQQAFIAGIAPGAVAAQHKYGVPASVTIAQAIVESGWGESRLATQDHNLFGIKGAGPAGSDAQPTWEYINGQQVSTTSPFRVYADQAQSIDDHGRLLAMSPYYRTSMAARQNPDAFAASLTGIYATDPDYGAKLISLMKRYDLYRYDKPAPASAPHAAQPRASSAPSSNGQTTRPPVPRPPVTARPSPRATASPAPTAGQSSPHEPSPAGSSPQASSVPEPPAGRSPSPAAGAPSAQPSGSPTSQSAVPPTRHDAVIPGLPNPAVATTPSARPTATLRRATATHGGGGGGDRPARVPAPAAQAASATRMPAPASATARRTQARPARRSARKYQQPLPPSVRNAFITKARVRLMRAEPLYRDVAEHSGIPWQVLGACDWMQCAARPRYSPVHGEKLGSRNADGTCYRTKSAALEQCADDMIDLAAAVYSVDLTAAGNLSVRDLANAFAAFRWGGLLKVHRTSAMEFPYSVAGLTDQCSKMHWPDIDEPNTPDKPGGRFRMPFGAVPVVLSLNYPATI